MLQERTPDIWNGRVLMARAPRLSGGVLTVRFQETDYASFVAWRDWGWPDRSVYNCFGSAVIVGSDGALLYGRMGGGTLNAGLLYPPGGSLEPTDVDAAGRVDVLASIDRELREETGLDAGTARRGVLLAVRDGQRISIAQALHFPEPAAMLRERVAAFIASESRPELAGAEVVSSASRPDSGSPGYAVEIARYFLKG
jgi:ADP-ribose pyrophosphatase YjhB (NUDIX family)